MDNTRKPLVDLGIKTLFLIWGMPKGSHRSQLMAQELGMDVERVYIVSRQGILSALLKYPIQAIKTLIVLARRRPQVVFIQNPPIFSSLIVYLYGLVTGVKYIIDSHTDALLASWWRWSIPLHRFLSRRAITTIVTNDHLYQIVADWGANCLVLADPPTTFPNRQLASFNNDSFNVVLVSGVSYDEPTREVLKAASYLPDVNFHVTGNYTKAHRDNLGTIPANIHFTGYMPDEEFYGLLEAAQVVMSLTTEDHTIQSGASESLWLGRPIITSDWPLLREYFCKGTIHVDNTADQICQAVETMRANLQTFESDIRTLQEGKRDEWWKKANNLVRLIQAAIQ